MSKVFERGLEFLGPRELRGSPAGRNGDVGGVSEKDGEERSGAQ